MPELRHPPASVGPRRRGFNRPESEHNLWPTAKLSLDSCGLRLTVGTMKQVINPLYPIAEIRGVDDLMDIAVAMEREAEQRYRQLAAEMDRQQELELADVFAELAVLEGEHEAGLRRWAEREGWRKPVPAQFSWQLPETFGSEADGAEARVLTPYRALSIAVRNEERAFSFYSYLAALSPNDRVRERAEALAREELNHVAQLRALRRRAYHADRGGTRGRVAVRSLDHLHAIARGLENGAAEVTRVASQVLAANGHNGAAKLLRTLADEARTRSAEFGAAATTDKGSSISEGARAATLFQPELLTPLGALRLALRDAEEILDTYMSAAEQGSDEAVVHDAQRLAQGAVARLAHLRALLIDVED